MYTDRIIKALNDCPTGGAVMLATTEEGCGGYGRVWVDETGSIEARVFGWPMLDPGDASALNSHLETLLRLGFEWDGNDWVWTRRFRPELVPVAAHAASRALLEVWELAPGTTASRMFTVHDITADELMGMALGSTCERCVGPCPHHVD